MVTEVMDTGMDTAVRINKSEIKKLQIWKN